METTQSFTTDVSDVTITNTSHVASAQEAHAPCNHVGVCGATSESGGNGLNYTIYVSVFTSIAVLLVFGIIVMFFLIRRRRRSKLGQVMGSQRSPRSSNRSHAPSRYYTGIFEDLNIATLSYANLKISPRVVPDDGISMVSLDNDDFLNSIEDIDYSLNFHGSSQHNNNNSCYKNNGAKINNTIKSLGRDEKVASNHGIRKGINETPHMEQYRKGDDSSTLHVNQSQSVAENGDCDASCTHDENYAQEMFNNYLTSKSRNRNNKSHRKNADNAKTPDKHKKHVINIDTFDKSQDHGHVSMVDGNNNSD